MQGIQRVSKVCEGPMEKLGIGSSFMRNQELISTSKELSVGKVTDSYFYFTLRLCDYGSLDIFYLSSL